MTGKHFIISYTDLAAAGSRCCLSIDGEKAIKDLYVPELSGDQSHDQDVAVVHEDGTNTSPVQILECKSEVTCIVVNCNIPSKVCHQVANRLLDHIIDSGGQQLTILSALHPDPRYESTMSGVMESCFNCKPDGGFQEIPQDFQVQDAFLNALLSLLKIEDIPTRFLVARGYRANKGCPSEADGSAQTIHSLQSALAKSLGLKFSENKTRQLKFLAPEDNQQKTKSMLYM